MATPKIEMKPDGRGDVEVRFGEQQGPNTSQREGDHVHRDHDRIQEVAKGDIQEDEDHDQRNGHDEQQSMLRRLHFLELAAPHGPIRGLEKILGRRLRLGHGTRQIAPAHAEFDRNQPLPLFAVNRRSAVPFKLPVRIGGSLVPHRRNQVAKSQSRRLADRVGRVHRASQGRTDSPVPSRVPRARLPDLGSASPCC